MLGHQQLLWCYKMIHASWDISWGILHNLFTINQMMPFQMAAIMQNGCQDLCKTWWHSGILILGLFAIGSWPHKWPLTGAPGQSRGRQHNPAVTGSPVSWGHTHKHHHSIASHLTHCGLVDLRKWTIFNTILTSPKSWLYQEDLDAGCEHSLVPIDSWGF